MFFRSCKQPTPIANTNLKYLIDMKAFQVIFRNSILAILGILVRIIELFTPRYLETLENYFALKQGKGWGYASTSLEASWVAHVYQEVLQKNEEAVILDIGANDGQYIDSLLENCVNMEVFAFEPSGDCFERLTRKYAHHKDIYLNQLAVGTHEGTVELFLRPKRKRACVAKQAVS